MENGAVRGLKPLKSRVVGQHERCIFRFTVKYISNCILFYCIQVITHVAFDAHISRN